ncbi:hypothetical protein [Frigoribacterium faeni]|uniref:Uncharacterized protein n=1 Tax=Frigoribacterium faeni TaxID=145483 RepID=A0A7W3JKN2_9MICO|nr:hypothetical protein [Frigoribacterium faeni]MBA8814644.1 hypothetical protein [Frigoribacterium faeni]BFF15560.1 hypothetical protein GCM10025699_68630 [Microbacterium flavescens]GEK83537.1 hypothetical protein FFA01_18460 [Frigoribacterium faeni]
MSHDMQPETSAAIRMELAALGTRASSLQRHQRRARVTASLVGVAAVALTTSAAALFVANAPGATVTSALGTTTTATHTGPALVDIGAAPATAGAVIIDVTCLNRVGVVQVPTDDGTSTSGIDCSVSDSGTMHVTDGQLPDGGTQFSVNASPGTTWRATLQYASSVTSEWGVNAQGQTYGIENRQGHPDLVPYTADNGRKGWVLWEKTFGADRVGTVDVYETDGVTVIGRATPPVGTLPEVPLDRGLIDDLESVETAVPSPSSTP